MMVLPVASIFSAPEGTFTDVPTASIRPLRTTSVALCMGALPVPSIIRAPTNAFTLLTESPVAAKPEYTKPEYTSQPVNSANPSAGRSIRCRFLFMESFPWHNSKPRRRPTQARVTISLIGGVHEQPSRSPRLCKIRRRHNHNPAVLRAGRGPVARRQENPHPAREGGRRRRHRQEPYRQPWKSGRLDGRDDDEIQNRQRRRFQERQGGRHDRGYRLRRRLYALQSACGRAGSEEIGGLTFPSSISYV